MKKRLLAMLLVLMLVVSLLPVGALADGDIWDGYGTFSYHISDSNLQAMVDAYNTTGASSGVDSVSITFDEDYTLGGQKTFLFRNGYTIGLSNTSTSVQPDDIDCLTITLINDTELKVSGDELDWTWVNTYPKRYDLRLKNSEKSTVTFYYQPGDSFTYDEYASVEVDSGTALNDLMPADPTDLGDYKFVGWEIGSDNGDGREFHADTIVSENIAVYARKISVGGGAEVNVINLENSIYSNAYEHFSTEPLEITGIALNGGGKSTNPDYDTTPGTGEWGVDTGWRDGNSYYYVYNVENHTEPEGGNYWNDRVDPYNLDSITIFTTAGNYDIPRDELDVRVKNDTKVEIYLREATESDTPVEPDPQPDPDPETNPDVNGVSVVVDCTTDETHASKTINIKEGTYTLHKYWDGDQWTCTVAITPDDYVDDYSIEGHTLNPANQTGTLLYIYDGSEWVYNGDGTPTVTFTVACSGTDPEPEEPRDPTEDELNQLYVDLECINADAQHAEKRFHLDQDNSYVTVDFTTGICTVEPRYDFILDTYNDQVADGHTYADDAEKTLLLFWNPATKAWDVAGDPSITRQVKCETPEQPGVYNIYVTVHNGTATFYGREVTSHILAAENEDITITFTPDEGYTLDYATIDGNMLLIPDGGAYTLKQVDSDHTIEVFYAEDKLGGGDDGTEPDGTPDYRQVFVKYVAADENGVVTPTFDTFNLEVDENGKVMTDDALSLSGVATPNADATFAYWTIEGLGYDGGAYSYEADLSGEDFTGYFADETYTFTAYFNGPVVKPEAYDINVEVVNGTAEFKRTNIGTNSVIKVYPIEDDNKNVTITFVPEDGFVFDAAYVGNEPVDLKDNSYTFGEVTADVTIKVLFKQDSVPITPVTPMPTPGEISDLIKDSITVDCVNGEVAHADKVYGLLDGSLVNVEKTDDISIKVTLDATVYQTRYNTDTETKHSLADGQSATVTFALNYVDQTWRVAEGELPITIKVVCETPVEPEPTPDPAITGFSKTLVKDRNLYVYQGLAYPTFYRGSVIVDEGDGVTLLYKITVKGTAGTEFTVRDDSADFAQTGEIPDSGETSFYVAKTFTWREIRRANELTNTAAVLLDGEVADSDTETVDVDIDWDYNPPVVDDDVFVPNWLNTTDHYAYIVGYEDGEVKPNNNITRAEVATIFFRLLTDDARARYWSQTNDYTDVAADSWYNNAISTLSNMGIINGYEDGTFQPNASITRAEFTAIATRFFDYTAEYDGAFNDVSRSAWYADCVQAAVDMGLVDGYPDGGFHPNSNITRAEAVTIVNRVLNRAPHEDHLLDEDEMNVWPDNVYGAWYYADMQEATNSHDYDWIRISGERVEEWTEKLPERDWAALEQEWSSAYSG